LGAAAQSRAEKMPAIASQPTGLTRCDSLAAFFTLRLA
jgi:hypothetical protein